MNGKGDRSTQEASCRIERLTRRLTLADPAAPRNETDISKLVSVSSRRNRRNAALRGHGTLADGRAGGLRETKSEAVQAKRKRLAGQRHTVTSLGCLRYRFDAHPPAHSVRGSPRRSVFSLRSSPSVRMLDRSRPAEARACLRTRHTPKRKSPPDTGSPISSHGAALQRAPCVPRLSGLFLPPCLPSVCVNGNRETQRFCFPQALRVESQSQALCLPSENRIGEFARTPLLPMPARHPF